MRFGNDNQTSLLPLLSPFAIFDCIEDRMRFGRCVIMSNLLRCFGFTANRLHLGQTQTYRFGSALGLHCFSSLELSHVPKYAPSFSLSAPCILLALTHRLRFVQIPILIHLLSPFAIFDCIEDWLRRSPCASTVLEQVRDGIRLKRGFGCGSAMTIKQVCCHCSHLSLSLIASKIGCGSAKSNRKLRFRLPLLSPFTIFAFLKIPLQIDKLIAEWKKNIRFLF